MTAMRSVRYGGTKLWILLSLLLCSGMVRAEDEMDPPGRVARLSFLDGSVSLAPADTDDWAAAFLNRPITTGDRIWVDAGGRAEVQLGTSTVHVDENTGVAFLTIDDDTLLVRLTDGAIAVRVHSIGANETVQVETPNTTVLLREPGEYAIETEEDGERTVVKAQSGEAEVTGPDSSQHGYIVGANEQGIFTGSDDLSSVMTQAGRRSGFELWAYEREAGAVDSVAANYVPPGTVGYQDLDSYGTWSSEPEYGNVWQPSMSYVSNDWAPYRYGRWIWVTPWGWTWSMIRRGAMRRPTTVAGRICGNAGAGCPARATSTPHTHRRWSRGSVRRVSACASATWAGCRSGQTKSTYRGAAVRGGTSTTSTRGTRWTTWRCRTRTTAATGTSTIAIAPRRTR